MQEGIHFQRFRSSISIHEPHVKISRVPDAVRVVWKIGQGIWTLILRELGKNPQATTGPHLPLFLNMNVASNILAGKLEFLFLAIISFI